MSPFVACFLILEIALCYGQFEKNVCLEDVELGFSISANSFINARKSCQGEDFGGDLVKIRNQIMQSAIQGAITVKPEYYIGAYDKEGDNTYLWLADNTAVPNRGASWGYENWKGNQPNNGAEKCVALGEHSVYVWSDVSCTNTYRYICQRGSDKMLAITKSDDTVTCMSSALSVAVRWKRNFVLVESRDTSGVYQTTKSNSATLHLENVKISEAGTYACESILPTCTAKKDYQVTVDGTPTIQSIKNNKCNASLLVTWKPNKAAVGFIHRLSVVNTMITSVTTPNISDSLTTELTGLQFSSNYTVQLQVCDVMNSCIDSFTAKSSGITDGVTESVSEAIIQYTGECKVAWNTSDSSATYTIEKKCRVNKFRTGGEGQQSINGTTVKTTFLFQPGPNRNCSAIIWAKGCGKISTAAEATGSCTTSPENPTKIEIPSLKVNGTSKIINLPTPSEDNGLISCIFIVLCYDKCSETQLTIQDLETASQIDVSNNSGQANSIALAISMSSVSGNQISRKLSQGEETSCDLYNTGLVAARSPGKVIEGSNVIDNKAKNVWAYAVTSTPSGSTVLLRTSSPIIVVEEIKTTTAGTDSTPTGEGTGGFQTWIIGPIAGIVVILILIIVVVLLIRRQKRRKQDGHAKPLNGNEAPVSHAETRLNGSMGQPEQFQNPVNPQEGEAGGGYMNFVAPVDNGTSINVRDLESRYNNMKNSGAFKVQYDGIVQRANKLGKTTNDAKNELVIKKNRYKNILPFDDSRVTLVGSESGYINASFVNGFRQSNRYIATQGPLKSTVADFWLMTMEQNSQIIVMLTREYDAGKKKCEKYWPDFGKTLNFSNGISVESRQETSCNSYIERIFFVQNKTTGKTLTTYQYQFMKWPDHGVPQTTSNLMRMQRVVTKKLNELGSQAPIIVHCSAGAGRTGAFIAYDVLLKESQATGKVDVYECVMEMRKRRIQMVQNCDQYTLVYKLLVEANIFDDCDVSADQAKAKVQEIISTPSGAKQLEKEFGQLDRIEPMKNQKLVGIEKKNRPYNRGRLAIPYDYSLVGVTMKFGETAVPYINASFVEAYDSSTRMIAAQSPFENTVEIFWRAVMDNNVTTIVMLCDLMEGREEQSAQYWPSTVGSSGSWGDITVVRTSDESVGNITERKMELKRGTEVKYVTQFHFTGWKEDSCPDDAREILDLVNKMQHHSRSAGDEAAVLVHCNDGIGRTGTFCAIVNLIDRMKWENRIDVFRTVKDLRDGRPYMVKTLDQYEFCYQTIVDYLKSFELYANF